MTDLAVAALVRRHAELAGEIEAAEAQLDQMRADLIHLHAAIRIMDPSADPATGRPKRPNRQGCPWFGHGELGRLMVDALREAEGPLTSSGVARRVMERRGLDPGDRLALRRMEGMVGPALRHREGRTVERVADGRALGWRVAGP
jgi:hypothetical protein